jgi:hypothetical protein
VETPDQIDALLSAQGGFALARSDIQSVWVSGSGYHPPPGHGSFTELTIRHTVYPRSAAGVKTRHTFMSLVAAA